MKEANQNADIIRSTVDKFITHRQERQEQSIQFDEIESRLNKVSERIQRGKENQYMDPKLSSNCTAKYQSSSTLQDQILSNHILEPKKSVKFALYEKANTIGQRNSQITFSGIDECDDYKLIDNQFNIYSQYPKANEQAAKLYSNQHVENNDIFSGITENLKTKKNTQTINNYEFKDIDFSGLINSERNSNNQIKEVEYLYKKKENEKKYDKLLNETEDKGRDKSFFKKKFYDSMSDKYNMLDNNNMQELLGGLKEEINKKKEPSKFDDSRQLPVKNSKYNSNLPVDLIEYKKENQIKKSYEESLGSLGINKLYSIDSLNSINIGSGAVHFKDNENCNPKSMRDLLKCVVNKNSEAVKLKLDDIVFSNTDYVTQRYPVPEAQSKISELKIVNQYFTPSKREKIKESLIFGKNQGPSDEATKTIFKKTFEKFKEQQSSKQFNFRKPSNQTNLPSYFFK